MPASPEGSHSRGWAVPVGSSRNLGLLPASTDSSGPQLGTRWAEVGFKGSSCPPCSCNLHEAQGATAASRGLDHKATSGGSGPRPRLVCLRHRFSRKFLDMRSCGSWGVYIPS